MTDSAASVGVQRLLTVAIVLLVLFALAMVLLGEYLAAGVTFLSVTFAIFLRETQT